MINERAPASLRLPTLLLARHGAIFSQGSLNGNMRDYILFYINGQRFQIGGKAAFGRLATFLRDERRLMGTKIVCAEGACGACGVLKGRMEGKTFRYRSINSCLQFLYQLDGCHIVTVEGLGRNGSLSAVQEAMIAAHGAQCGFCTPGVVVALTSALERGEVADNTAEVVSGNLCRCTGYLPILEAGKRVDINAYQPLSQLYPEAEMAADFSAHRAEPVEIKNRERTLFAPTTLGEAVQWRGAHPEAALVAGATELGVPPSFELGRAGTIISLGNIAELSELRRDGETLILGAGATWTEVEEFARTEFPELAAYLQRFAAPSLRNVGTVAGSIVQGSPIADSLPPLLVIEAWLEVMDVGGSRRVSVNAFSEGEAKGGLVCRVFLPLPRPDQTLRLFKVSSRRGFDRSLVSAAFLLEKDAGRVQTLRIALGGVGPRVMRLPQTEAFLQGRSLDETSLRAAGSVLRMEIAPVSDGRASAEYRGLLAENMLLKFFGSLERNA